MATRTAAETTSDRILDIAEDLVQTRGLNAMSYADIAERLGIRKASLHYHFPAKSDMVRALIARYSDRFFGALAELDQQEDALMALRGYAGVYGGVLSRGRMCLCGMLASDFETLTPESKQAVMAFFDRNAAWLEATIRRGIREGRLATDIEPRAAAETLVAGLEGAMLVSRPFPDMTRFDAVSAALIDGLAAR